MQVEVTRGVIFGMETGGERGYDEKVELLIAALVSVSELAGRKGLDGVTEVSVTSLSGPHLISPTAEGFSIIFQAGHKYGQADLQSRRITLFSKYGAASEP